MYKQSSDKRSNQTPPDVRSDQAPGCSHHRKTATRKISTFTPPPALFVEDAEGIGNLSGSPSRDSLRKRFSIEESPIPIPANTSADDLIFINTLSSSSLADVVLVKRKDTKQIIAAKAFNHSSWRSEYLCHAELRVFQNVNSPWIVHFFGYIQDLSEDFLLLEYLPYGSLLELVHKHTLNESQLKFYVAEMFLAVDSLHQEGIMHRNVQLSNFMIHKSGHLRIIGFGLSYQFEKGVLPKGSDTDMRRFLNWKNKPKLNRITNPVYASPDKAITLEKNTGGQSTHVSESSTSYMSPEMLRLVMPKPYYIFQLTRRRSGYSYLCDYWSLGVAIYRLLYGHYPFTTDSSGLVIDKVLNHRNNLSFPFSCSSLPCSALVRALLKKEGRRLGRYRGFAEVKDHDFFTDVQWSRLGHGEVSVPISPEESCRYTNSEIVAEAQGGVNYLFQDRRVIEPLFESSSAIGVICSSDSDTTFILNASSCSTSLLDEDKASLTKLDDALCMAANNLELPLLADPNVGTSNRGRPSTMSFYPCTFSSNEPKTLTGWQKLCSWFQSLPMLQKVRNSLEPIFSNTSIESDPDLND